MTQNSKPEIDRDIITRFGKGMMIQIYINKGWIPLVNQLHKDLVAIDPDYTIAQIKEKFGGLRYYINSGTDEMWELIDKAEAESFNICELCGEPGESMNNNGWLITRCPAHDPREKTDEGST